MSLRDQKRWEISQLNESIDFDCVDIQLDSAPFQLVEKTPISKVHRLFTILSLRRAYVTHIGTLVGVVGLKELQCAIKNANDGNFIIGCDDIAHIAHDDKFQTQNSSAVNDASDSVANDVEKAH